MLVYYSRLDYDVIQQTNTFVSTHTYTHIALQYAMTSYDPLSFPMPYCIMLRQMLLLY